MPNFSRIKIARQQKENKINSTNVVNKDFLDKKLYQSDNVILPRLLQLQEKYQEVFPSYEYLQQATGYSIKTIQRSINRLVSLGLLIKTKRKGFNKSNLYVFPAHMKEESTIRFLKKYYGLLFAMTLLFSFPASWAWGDRLRITKEDNLQFVTVVTVTKTTTKQQRLLYEPDRYAPWTYIVEDQVPLSPEIVRERLRIAQEEDLFSSKLSKKENEMHMFTDEQLQQLSHYPRETIDYAHKIMTRDVAAGKSINNLFAYFTGICNNYTKPTTETSKPHFSPLSPSVTVTKQPTEYQAPNRAQEHHDWQMKVYKRQAKLHEMGIEWQGLSYADMKRVYDGYLPAASLSPDRQPPVEPVYTQELSFMTNAFQSLVQSVTIKQPIKSSSYDPITPQIDYSSLYEQFEEILD